MTSLRLRAEDHAYANFLRALGHRVRHHRVESDRGQQQRDPCEDGEHAAEDLILPAAPRHQLVHRTDVEYRNVGIEREHGLPDQRHCRRSLTRRADDHGDRAPHARAPGNRGRRRPDPGRCSEPHAAAPSRRRRRWSAIGGRCRPRRPPSELICRPSGSSPLKYISANRWFTITPPRPGVSSDALKPRPRAIGMPTVSKYFASCAHHRHYRAPGVRIATAVNRELERPSTAEREVARGRHRASIAPIPSRRSRSRRAKLFRSAGVGYFRSLRLTCMVSRCGVSKPRSRR